MSLFDPISMLRQGVGGARRSVLDRMAPPMGASRPMKQTMAPAQGADPNLGLLMLMSGKIQPHLDMSGQLINPAVRQPTGLDAFYAANPHLGAGGLPKAPAQASAPVSAPTSGAPLSLEPRQAPAYEPMTTRFFNSDTPMGGASNPQGVGPAGQSNDWQTGIDPVTGQPTMRPKGIPWIQTMFGAKPHPSSTGVSELLANLRRQRQ